MKILIQFDQLLFYNLIAFLFVMLIAFELLFYLIHNCSWLNLSSLCHHIYSIAHGTPQERCHYHLTILHVIGQLEIRINNHDGLHASFVSETDNNVILKTPLKLF